MCIMMNGAGDNLFLNEDLVHVVQGKIGVNRQFTIYQYTTWPAVDKISCLLRHEIVYTLDTIKMLRE